MRSCAHLAAPRVPLRAPPPTANLGLLLASAGVALSGSTVGLVGLNILQNGPEKALSLDTVLEASPAGASSITSPQATSAQSGTYPSGPFTPTDNAPESLGDVLMLRTKADVVRAWRNGATPALPGAEVYDGAVLRRGVLSPASSFITHRLFGAGTGRWRGKAFSADGGGTNRFGGAQRNRFGVTSSDARELERQFYEQKREQQAMYDPLMQEQMKAERTAAEREADQADAAADAAAYAESAGEEVRKRGFAARIEPSRLDGKPALVLDYGAGGAGAADALWGKVLGMRDELREVAPGVLVGLGSMRATGGVRNCAPFVLARAEDE